MKHTLLLTLMLAPFYFYSADHELGNPFTCPATPPRNETMLLYSARQLEIPSSNDAAINKATMPTFLQKYVAHTAIDKAVYQEHSNKRVLKEIESHNQKVFKNRKPS